MSVPETPPTPEQRHELYRRLAEPLKPSADALSNLKRTRLIADAAQADEDGLIRTDGVLDLMIDDGGGQWRYLRPGDANWQTIADLLIDQGLVGYADRHLAEHGWADECPTWCRDHHKHGPITLRHADDLAEHVAYTEHIDIHCQLHDHWRALVEVSSAYAQHDDTEPRVGVFTQEHLRLDAAGARRLAAAILNAADQLDAIAAVTSTV